MLSDHAAREKHVLEGIYSEWKSAFISMKKQVVKVLKISSLSLSLIA